MATPLFLMSTNTSQTQPDDKPAPRPNLENPKPRCRRGSKSKQGGPKKQAQRGMGVAQLERLLSQQQQQPGPSPGPIPQHFPYHQVNPLLCGYPVQPVRLPHYGPRSAVRAEVGSSHELELPSLPNMVKQESTYVDHFLKKRVVGDEVGFMRGKYKYDYDQINAISYSGFDLNNSYNPHHLAHNVGFSSYDPATEVVAIHRKGHGSSMVMKEYGFFPDKSNSNSNSNSNSGENFNNGSNITSDSTNNYYNMENLLNLNMGCSSNPAHSPSSSVSSLSSNPPIPSTISLDLSLKLSY